MCTVLFFFLLTFINPEGCKLFLEESFLKQYFISWCPILFLMMKFNWKKQQKNKIHWHYKSFTSTDYLSSSERRHCSLPTHILLEYCKLVKSAVADWAAGSHDLYEFCQPRQPKTAWNSYKPLAMWKKQGEASPAKIFWSHSLYYIPLLIVVYLLNISTVHYVLFPASLFLLIVSKHFGENVTMASDDAIWWKRKEPVHCTVHKFTYTLANEISVNYITLFFILYILPNCSCFSTTLSLKGLF